MESSKQPNALGKLFKVFLPVGAGMLLCSLCSNAYEVVHNVQLHRETQAKALRIQLIQGKSNDWQMFIQDLMAYSSRQSAVDPILQKYALKPAPASAPSKLR